MLMPKTFDSLTLEPILGENSLKEDLLIFLLEFPHGTRWLSLVSGVLAWLVKFSLRAVNMDPCWDYIQSQFYNAFKLGTFFTLITVFFSFLFSPRLLHNGGFPVSITWKLLHYLCTNISLVVHKNTWYLSCSKILEE